MAFHAERAVPHRRHVLTTAAAFVAAPGLVNAQDPFAAAVERARAVPQLHSLIIARAGETAVAVAIRGPALDRPANVKSVSKTVIAALTGAAIDRGVVPGTGARLGAIAPALIPPGSDPRVAALTVEDLLTLQAGLARTSGAGYGAWVSSPNWVRYALTRPFVAEPGRRMLYSTGTTHVLGAALAEASGRSLLALARDWLGAPLGIEIPAWTRDPQGYYLGGNDMALSPQALLRFAEMYRNGGRYGARQVLPAAFVRDSFKARGRSPWSGMGYGFGWFLARADGVDYALARGYGGQVIALVPDRRLSVVITSDPTRPARSEGYFGDLRRLIEDAIIPA